ncbi:MULTISPECIES: hypothetical protein [unclassified Roseateles]|uniref:hypothetical protein n=1 Tax=unclassified Roseateles TaxID=2626991 RepID=UPI000A7E1A58|nr:MULTISPECIES: hypothetical protein [unclassified Roseateles]
MAKFKINGARQERDLAPDMPLLWARREEFLRIRSLPIADALFQKKRWRSR